MTIDQIKRLKVNDKIKDVYNNIFIVEEITNGDYFLFNIENDIIYQFDTIDLINEF